MPTCDFTTHEFHKMVILGESTVQGGEWLVKREYRFADILVGLINLCQEHPIEYLNKGIAANVISPRSPGYKDSAKPSAQERYREDVIALHPDLFILCYGLNDMRAGMHLEEFRQDMQAIISDVSEANHPVIVLTTVYHMTGYRSWPPFDRGSQELTALYNEVIRQLARRNACILADVYGAEAQADWLIHHDGVHANRVGNLLIANKIFEAIAQHCSGVSDATFRADENTAWTTTTVKQRAAVGDSFRRTWGDIND
jgi:lysophospholipase L1-like esterase